MAVAEATLIILTLLSFAPTLASLSRSDQWWIRGFDFPRLQISILLLLVLGASFAFLSFDQGWHILIPVLLLGNFFYQASKIYPYTFFAKKQVKWARKKEGEGIISVLVSNVLAKNTHYERLKARVKKERPDLLLTLESNHRWEQELSELEEDYPFSVKIPQDNLYGMHLYSRLELQEMEVKNIISSEIPSIHGYVTLRNGKQARMHCLHPKPPSPGEDTSSTNRDAELLVVGKDIKKDQETTMVFGDLNDVAWSRTTRLFQAISGLLDPRIGRGFYNTFHAGYPFFRWPLDHLFHTDDFSLVELRRLKSIGSDHFPIFIKLCYEPRAEEEQEELSADREERQWAEEKIEDGEPNDRDPK